MRRKPQKSYRRNNERDSYERRKKRRQESACLVDIDPGHVEGRKEVEREAQDDQGFNKNCRDSMPTLSRPIRYFRVTGIIDPPLARTSASSLE